MLRFWSSLLWGLNSQAQWLQVIRAEMKRVREECIEPLGDSVPRFEAHKFLWHKCWPQGTGSNIVRDFVVRGLYLEQIKDYHKHFPREQLLILSDRELKDNTSAVLNRVFQFVGLPPLPAGMIDPKALNEQIERQWPGFESASGWHLQSK